MSKTLEMLLTLIRIFWSVITCNICKDAPEVLFFDGNAKLRCSMDFQRLVDIKPQGILDSLVGKEVVNFKMAPIID